MPTVGSNGGLSGNVMAGLVDRFGVPVISTGNEFGDEQIGYAMRSGLLFGVQNATFDYTPPDPTAEIQNSSNPLPFWQIDNASNGADGLPQIAGSAIFDSTTGTWGVNINPGTAAAGATYTLRTRSFVLNDDNLQLRQKAFATLAKVGTYAGSSQWNCVLRAIYWAHSGSAIGTTTIGTVYDNTTWTGISGYTTSGGSAFSSTADSVDLEFIFTTTATVSSSTSLTIKSLLLATSSLTSGNFIQSVPFTASGSWTAPLSVSTVQIILGGGGGGGGSGSRASGNPAGGGAGGGGGGVMYTAPLAVTGGSTYTIGIGTAGVGGTSVRGAASIAGVTGGAGGVTSFGTIAYAYGGLGGSAGRTGDFSTGGAAGSVVGGGFGKVYINGGVGGNGGSGNGTAATAGGAGQADTTIGISNTAGSAGVPAGSTAGSGGALGFGGAGGGGAGGISSTAAAGGVGGGGGGGGKGTALGGTAGAGGNAGTYSSGGGGGGGCGNTVGTDVASSGAGGNGGAGWLVVLYQG